MEHFKNIVIVFKYYNLLFLISVDRMWCLQPNRFQMMDVIGGRRRGATNHTAEDQALDQIAKEVSG